ncbi:MAG: nucleoside deaminase [Nocardioides sp.]|nr:nucleoside deaminase [Nocardioides sp.]
MTLPDPVVPEDDAWLRRAIELAVANVAAGGGPFGAVVVRDGELVATGVNRVTIDLDPTAHAEVSAIRAACRALGDFSLAGCTLYSSCEPCPLCAASALWARLDRMGVAADRHDAARVGFDDRNFYELLGTDPAAWPMHVVAHRVESADEPFAAWLAKEDRQHY